MTAAATPRLSPHPTQTWAGSLTAQWWELPFLGVWTAVLGALPGLGGLACLLAQVLMAQLDR